MTVYVRKEPWPAITRAVQRSGGQVVAASGYVGQGAFERLPLRRGDLLVCDASLRTVRRGATNPSALRAFLQKGVEVRSEPGLHAKVVVLPNRAFVGSANASDNSARKMLEAVLETSSTSEVRELRNFVSNLGSTRVTLQMIGRLEKEFPKRVWEPTGALDSDYPDRVDRVVVFPLAREEWSDADTRVWEQGQPTARSKARASHTGYELEEFAWRSLDSQFLREGDLVLQLIDSDPSPPGTVVHIERSRGRAVVWLARPDSAPSDVTIDQLGLKGRLGQTDCWELRGKRARQVIDLYRVN